jgi:hypothetical protein
VTTAGAPETLVTALASSDTVPVPVDTPRSVKRASGRDPETAPDAAGIVNATRLLETGSTLPPFNGSTFET